MTEAADQLRLVEAILFASASPVSEAEIARFLPEETDVPGVMSELAQLYSGRGVNLVQVGKAWAFRTADDLTPYMRREQEVHRKLSRAAIETLAIVAYHQPVTRAEIEEIRGVGLSRGTLDVLLEAGWVKPRGRRRSPGRPVTWGTSQAFLDHFGLQQLEDLPGLDELEAAGLLDKRPALTALASRGSLTDPAEAMDTEELATGEDEDDFEEQEGQDALEQDFGEDLVGSDQDPGAGQDMESEDEAVVDEMRQEAAPVSQGQAAEAGGADSEDEEPSGSMAAALEAQLAARRV